MHLIAITGGIATGKSLVTSWLRDKGYTVLDGDEIARQVVQVGEPALKQIQEEFGSSVLSPAGDLDRAALADIVFNDEGKRKKLNAIVHPAIYRAMLRRALALLLHRHSIVFLDLPLLFESGTMLKYISKVIVVSCRPEQQLERLMSRNRLSEAEAKLRIESQMSLEEKCKKADFVVSNTEDRASTLQQVDQIEAVLSEKYKSWISRYLLLDGLLLLLGALVGWFLAAWFQK